MCPSQFELDRGKYKVYMISRPSQAKKLGKKIYIFFPFLKPHRMVRVLYASITAGCDSLIPLDYSAFLQKQ